MSYWQLNDVFTIYDYMHIVGISVRFMYFTHDFRLYDDSKIFFGLTKIKYQFINNEESLDFRL